MPPVHHRWMQMGTCVHLEREIYLLLHMYLHVPLRVNFSRWHRVIPGKVDLAVSYWSMKHPMMITREYDSRGV